MIRPKPQSTGISAAYERWHRIWHRCFMWVESHFNHILPEKFNPFYFLGALTVFNMLILVVTGIYMFIYYSPSVETVYESVQYVNEEAFLGSLVRSVHQYASDLMLLLILLHMVRVFVQDKYRKYRWLAWVSGVVMFFFSLLEGVIGHIMAWNERSQFIAVQTSELIAALKVFGEDLPRAFSQESLLSTWIMWILLALHILIPIAFIFLIYIHVSRISRARLLPPRPLMAATLIFLIGFSLLFPVKLLDKADLMKIPTIEEVDWFYLFLTPFLEGSNPYLIWGGTSFIFVFIIAAPWFRKPPEIDVADVDLDHCTGCGVCAKDCPYEAIYMQPRTDGRKFKMESVIIDDRCAGCGICVGSCDFGGMNLTQFRIQSIEDELEQLTTPTGSAVDSQYVGVFCQNSVADPQVFDMKNSTLKDESRLKVMSVPCAGMVGPSFVKSAMDKGAKGMLIAACRTNDCHYREGNLWLKERLNGQRVPKLRLKDESKPVTALSFSPLESQSFIKETKSLLDQWDKKSAPPNKRGVYKTVKHGSRAASIAALVGVFSLALFFYAWGVLDPWGHGHMSVPNRALLKINYFHLSDNVSCDTKDFKKGVEQVRSQVNDMTRKDNVSEAGQIQSVSGNLVSALLCPRERVPVHLNIVIDDNPPVQQSFMPAGISNDGLTYVTYELEIPTGNHRVSINMVDSKVPSRSRGISFYKEVNVSENEIVFIDFNEKLGKFYIRSNSKESS